MTIQTVWFACDDCGLPVVMVDGFLEECAVDGRFGAEQTPSGVEHECNP